MIKLQDEEMVYLLGFAIKPCSVTILIAFKRSMVIRNDIMELLSDIRYLNFFPKGRQTSFEISQIYRDVHELPQCKILSRGDIGMGSVLLKLKQSQRLCRMFSRPPGVRNRTADTTKCHVDNSGSFLLKVFPCTAMIFKQAD
ncbi:hypothetical protein RF11_04251 [Thelohanellus kitauei]|uniref:Uncharacterized protein n=1 Tax=Thelohanellus kitauei TaxID=669202 RepID=A0A0C2N1R9_THEKT|nr:hypothetical protein RF11_04251 [Thelohanellus kitauei]